MRVKLLVGILAWRYAPSSYDKGANRTAEGAAYRYLLPSEELTRYSPGIVRDREGKLWKCPESFLEDVK